VSDFLTVKTANISVYIVPTYHYELLDNSTRWFTTIPANKDITVTLKRSSKTLRTAIMKRNWFIHVQCHLPGMKLAHVISCM